MLTHPKCKTCKRKKRCANLKVVHRQGCMRHTDNVDVNEIDRHMFPPKKGKHYFFSR